MRQGAAPRPHLRLEVGRLRQRESRRVFDPSVHVGRLAGPRDSCVVRAQDLPVIDRALRVELVSALLADQETADQDTGEQDAWLVRPGPPELHDSDLAWLAATSFAFTAHGVGLTGFYVVTRTGWLDVQTGESQVWKRLRI